ncbi:MAG: hypothetical protein Q4A71_07250 [Actinomycetaceae bacterium]|nr:hypothetical protein [Actinomycetaceae bacterium]
MRQELAYDPEDYESRMTWSFLGKSQPTWALALGWSLVVATIPIYVIFVLGLDRAQIAGIYGVIAGIVSGALAVKLKSWNLLTYSILTLISYVLAVLYLGVNTP